MRLLNAGRVGNVFGRLGCFVVVGNVGAEPFQESKEVSVMQKILAVAMLGVSLAFASSTAFAGIGL